MPHERLQAGAVQGMAQVDHQRGQQHHGEGRAAGQQADGDELRRAGEHQRGHAEGLPRRQPGGAGKAAEDDAERHRAEQHRGHIAQGLQEFVTTGHGLSSGQRRIGARVIDVLNDLAHEFGWGGALRVVRKRPSTASAGRVGFSPPAHSIAWAEAHPTKRPEGGALCGTKRPSTASARRVGFSPPALSTAWAEAHPTKWPEGGALCGTKRPSTASAVGWALAHQPTPRRGLKPTLRPCERAIRPGGFPRVPCPFRCCGAST